MKRFKRINPVSARRRRRDALYATHRRLVHERANGRCEAPVHTDGCSGRCVETHHLAGRGGPDPHRLDNLVGLSSECHSYVHLHPAWAREVGLMRSRLTVIEGTGGQTGPGGDAA